MQLIACVKKCFSWNERIFQMLVSGNLDVLPCTPQDEGKDRQIQQAVPAEKRQSNRPGSAKTVQHPAHGTVRKHPCCGSVYRPFFMDAGIPEVNQLYKPPDEANQNQSQADHGSPAAIVQKL